MRNRSLGKYLLRVVALGYLAAVLLVPVGAVLWRGVRACGRAGGREGTTTPARPPPPRRPPPLGALRPRRPPPPLAPPAPAPPPSPAPIALFPPPRGPP